METGEWGSGRLSEVAEKVLEWGSAESGSETGLLAGKSFEGFVCAPGSAAGRNTTEEAGAGVDAGSRLSWNGVSVAVIGAAVAAEWPAQTGRASGAGGESAAGCQQAKEDRWGTRLSSLVPAWCGGSGLAPVKPPGDSLAGSHDPLGTPEQLAAQLALPGSAGLPGQPALFGSRPCW